MQTAIQVVASPFQVQAPPNEALKPEYRVYIEQEKLCSVFRDPLYVLPYDASLNHHINECVTARQQRLDEYLSVRDYEQAIWLHARGFRLHAMIEYMEEMEDQDYWRILAQVWVDTECPSIALDEWLELFEAFRRGREHMMKEAERRVLQALPRYVTIHRGTHHKSDLGLSWTLNKEVAVWFAHRFSESYDEHFLMTARCKRSDIIAYLNGREEQEVIVHPANVKKLVVEPLAHGCPASVTTAA